MAEKTHDNDVAFIKALAEVLRDNDLTELHVKREYAESDWLNVRIAKQTQAAPAQVVMQAPAAAAMPAPAAAEPVAAAAAVRRPMRLLAEQMRNLPHMTQCFLLPSAAELLLFPDPP